MPALITPTPSRNSIEEWYTSDAPLDLQKDHILGVRKQACINLYTSCLPDALNSLGLQYAEEFFKKMIDTHKNSSNEKNRKIAVCFDDNKLRRQRRQGFVFHVLKTANYEFDDMPHKESIGLQVYTMSNTSDGKEDEESAKNVLNLWSETLKIIDASHVKPRHLSEAFNSSKINDVQTELAKREQLLADLQTQLQTQAQQTEDQVAARVAEEKERMEADYQKKLALEISNKDNDVRYRIEQLSDDVIHAEEKTREIQKKSQENLAAQKKEADEKLAAKEKEIEEEKKKMEDEYQKKLEEENSNRPSFVEFTAKESEIERLKKLLEEQGTRLASERRESTASDITLVDPTRGTKRALTADENADLEKLNKRLKIAEECLDKIGNNTYLAYYKLMGTDSLEQVSDYDELCNLFKENKTLTDDNQSPKYEIKIHHDEKSGGIVMKDIAQWRNLAWRHFKKLVGRIESSLEKKKESYSDLEFDEAVSIIAEEDGGD